ncbi:MAG: PEGA domain-containing protein [Bdellovibrionota bacterium]
MMFTRYASLVLLSVSLLMGCRYFQSEATVSIQALTGEGEALPNAKVVVNKIHVGQTDDHGFYKGHMELPIDEPILIEVSKGSKEIFYAPFFETIKVKRGDLNTFKLTATLYGVKPVSDEVPAAPVPASELMESAAASDETPSTLEVIETSLPTPTLSTATDANASAAETVQPASEGRPVTFYIVSGRDAVENAAVYFGDAAKKQWIQGCYANASGRCTFRIPSNLDAVTILIRAKGFQTQSKSFELLDGDKVRIDLARGKSLEVFAINPNQGNMEGVEGIKVYLNEKELGTTDRFGSLLAPITTEGEMGGRITLTSEQWLPAKVEIKRDAFSSDSIIQHFQSLKPIAPKLAIMEFIHYRAGGDSTLLSPPSLDSLTATLVSAGANVVNSPALRGKFAEQKLSLDDLSATNFNQVKKVAESMNYIIRPSFIEGAEARIILSAIDLQGRMTYSASQSVKAKGSTDAVLAELSQRLMQNIRHEGSIIENQGEDQIRINIGKNHGLAIGDKLTITGNARLPSGEITAWDTIASAVVVDAVAERSRIKILQTQPNARIEAGNNVALDRKPSSTKDSINLTAQEVETQAPIGLAELYKGDHWLGFTDATGHAAVSEIELLKSSEIAVFSPGFLPKAIAVTPESKTYTIALNHVATPIQIESQPEGALVKINGRDLGRTPIDTEIPYPGAAVNIEIGGVDGFEFVTRTQSVGARGIVLRGNTAITLNRDPLQAAKAMATEGKLTDAAQLLEGIPESDNSYLLAQHQLGELFLNNLKDPVKAATAFHKVTSSPKVESFSDKRFIGTFINEAVALFQAGENAVAADPNLAISFWRQSEAILKRTESELRFVPQAQYSQAVHTLNYYRALALHKTWTVTQNGDDQKSAMQYWKDYIQGTALALPQDQHYDWVKKAEGYFQQIQTARKSLSRDSKAPVAM